MGGFCFKHQWRNLSRSIPRRRQSKVTVIVRKKKKPEVPGEQNNFGLNFPTKKGNYCNVLEFYSNKIYGLKLFKII